MIIIRRLSKLSILLAMCASSYAFAGDDQGWELQRDKDGIQVHTRPVEGSPYDAVLTITRVTDVRLSSLVALIEDAPACTQWTDSCAESYLVERLSDSESLVYTHKDLPFPAQDRDVLAQVEWTQNPLSLQVKMNSIATKGKMEEVRGRMRLTNAVASWTLAPQMDGSILISYENHINPGSALPGWLMNKLLIEAPFETMSAFVDEVRDPKYADAELSFIREPAEFSD